MPAAPLAVAADAVAALLGFDPSKLVSPPYHEEKTIRADLTAAGFRHIEVNYIERPATAASARDAAIATVHGSLIRSVIQASAPGKMDEATDAAEIALRAKPGDGEIVGTTKALLILAR